MRHLSPPSDALTDDRLATPQPRQVAVHARGFAVTQMRHVLHRTVLRRDVCATRAEPCSPAAGATTGVDILVRAIDTSRSSTRSPTSRAVGALTPMTTRWSSSIHRNAHYPRGDMPRDRHRPVRPRCSRTGLGSALPRPAPAADRHVHSVDRPTTVPARTTRRTSRDGGSAPPRCGPILPERVRRPRPRLHREPDGDVTDLGDRARPKASSDFGCTLRDAVVILLGDEASPPIHPELPAQTGRWTHCWKGHSRSHATTDT